MSYILGSVTAVPTANRDAYLAHIERCAPVFRELGALSMVEAWGDDVPPGVRTSLPMAVQAKPDETVVFAWMTWPSREAMAASMERAMADPRMAPDVNPMPFDGSRMIWGGFVPLLELGAPQDGGYIDGYAIAVPSDGREAFLEFARQCDPVFMEYGATWIVEGWDDYVPEGKVTDFRRAVAAQDGESVVFSWVQWPDKATRDAGSKRMMEDKRFAGMTMPFDGGRMIYGGFVPLYQG